MCLSRIYTGEKTDENCVMEEAARVALRKDGVEVSTLFGESKTLHDYSINEVDFMENFVTLKKEQKEHTHNHGHEENKGSAAGKLRKLLPYLLAHNRGHADDLKKWALKAEETGYKEVAEELKNAIDLFNKINDHFEKALSVIEK